MLRFTEDHEWLRVEGDVATVGITEHASGELGDLVFVELPDVGTKFDKGDVAATVESVKAASEIYAPLTGEIVEINDAIVSNPAMVNSEPADGGWFFKMKLDDVAAVEALLDDEAYGALIG